MDLDEWIKSLMKTERPVKFPHSMYYSEGTKYLNLLQLEKALKYLDDAVKQDSTHIKSLLNRSKCHIGLRNYQKAMEDADRVLKIVPSHIDAIDLKGQAQYLMGDFEGGFSSYLEGIQMHPLSNKLRLGNQLCREALNNLESCRETYFIDDVVNVKKSKSDDKKFASKLRKQRSSRECFGEDIKFMEDLMADKNLSSIHAFCKEAVDYIKNRERFWCMETPFISRKRRQILKLREIKKTNKAVKQIRICSVTKRRAENDLQKGGIDECISGAENLLTFAQSLPTQWEKEKMKFKCDGYHLLSLVYKKEKMSALAQEYLLKELEIANEYNLKLQQTKAYHQLGEYFQLAGDVKKTLQCFRKVIDAMEPEKIDELTLENASPGDIQQIQEAHAWASNIIAGIRMAIRESIFTPILDSIMRISGDVKPEKLTEPDETFDSKQQNLSNRMKDSFESLNQGGKTGALDEQKEDAIQWGQSVKASQSEKSGGRAEMTSGLGKKETEEISQRKTEDTQKLNEQHDLIQELIDSISEENEEKTSIALNKIKDTENLTELHDLIQQLIDSVSEGITTGSSEEETEKTVASSEMRDAENLAELKNFIEKLMTSVSKDTETTTGLNGENTKSSYASKKIKETENLGEQNNLIEEQIDSASEDKEIITDFCKGKTEKPIASDKIKINEDLIEITRLIGELITSVSKATEINTALSREKTENSFASNKIKDSENLSELNNLLKDLINSILEEAEATTKTSVEKIEESATSSAIKVSDSFEEVNSLLERLINSISEDADSPSESSSEKVIMHTEKPHPPGNVLENSDVNWTDQTSDTSISDDESDMP